MSCTGVPSSLGFAAVKCCPVPCPNLPVHKVTICFRVNKNTQIQIQQGCPIRDSDCSVSYSTGLTEDSWGRQCRVVTWDHFVESDKYIRILVCGASGSCFGSSCGEALNTKGQRIKNQLLKYTVDGINIVNLLQYILINGDTSGCIRVGCVNEEGPDCCHNADGTPSFTTLQDIPWNSEIVVGPIGQDLGVSSYSA